MRPVLSIAMWVSPTSMPTMVSSAITVGSSGASRPSSKRRAAKYLPVAVLDSVIELSLPTGSRCTTAAIRPGSFGIVIQSAPTLILPVQ